LFSAEGRKQRFAHNVPVADTNSAGRPFARRVRRDLRRQGPQATLPDGKVVRYLQAIGRGVQTTLDSSAIEMAKLLSFEIVAPDASIEHADV
jgi:hypothetical protein